MSNSIICLVTGSYPYDVAAEDTFLKNEVLEIPFFFNEVFIIPKNSTGNKANIPLPIKIDINLSKILKNAKKITCKNFFFIIIYVFFSIDFFKEIIRKPSVLFYINNFLWLIFYQFKRRIISNYFSKWILNNNLYNKKIVFYTFWLDEATHGISDVVKKFPKTMHVISRAHGIDLYEERSKPPYFPFRPAIFKQISFVFADSKKGCDYLKKKYPIFSKKFQISYMGLKNIKEKAFPSNDKVLRIVSCSMIRKIKRIELIILSLKKFSDVYKNIKVEWTHFGNKTGELSILDLKKLIKVQNFSVKINIKFIKYKNQSRLYDFYLNNPIDCFLTLSESEGTPVSILEALNCSIPIIATAVGGITETVSKNNGFLLSQDPTPEEVANNLFKLYLLRKSKTINYMKRASKLTFRKNFDAGVNYKNFFTIIKKLTKT
jgi:glycosyltransferase involved in cell wall biosynthesis